MELKARPLRLSRASDHVLLRCGARGGGAEGGGGAARAVGWRGRPQAAELPATSAAPAQAHAVRGVLTITLLPHSCG